jgi:hypothetical protein
MPVGGQTIVPAAPSVKNKVIKPINDPNVSKVDIKELLDKELAKEAGVDLANRPTVATTQQEKSEIDNEIDKVINTPPPEPPAGPPPPPKEHTLAGDIAAQEDEDNATSMDLGPAGPTEEQNPPAEQEKAS